MKRQSQPHEVNVDDFITGLKIKCVARKNREKWRRTNAS